MAKGNFIFKFTLILFDDDLLTQKNASLISHEDFRRRVNPMEDLRALMKESSTFWSNLILRYILGRPCVLSQGILKCVCLAKKLNVTKK